MSEAIRARGLPPASALIASALVAAGVLLWMFVDKSLLMVAGLGAFGPGILREMGILRDHDEFQREAARRAGYHAYLIGGMATAIAASVMEWDAAGIAADGEWPLVVLLVMWLTWLFSAVTGFWGAQRTASTVLVVFGSFIALFVLADAFGESNPGIPLWERVLGFLVGTMLIGSFFVPAWTARRWPRPTGAALLVLAFVLAIVFRVSPQGEIRWSMVGPIDIVIFGPLLASGIALLRRQNGSGQEADDADTGAGPAEGAAPIRP